MIRAKSTVLGAWLTVGLSPVCIQRDAQGCRVHPFFRHLLQSGDRQDAIGIREEVVYVFFRWKQPVLDGFRDAICSEGNARGPHVEHYPFSLRERVTKEGVELVGVLVRLAGTLLLFIPMTLLYAYIERDILRLLLMGDAQIEGHSTRLVSIGAGDDGEFHLTRG